ncbi:USP8 dimerization domain-containing protein [Zopfochytrium polystomum]|nr:USP8 dimerization domain-containing protein [Zopfochytrium polystomum]
MVRMPPPSMPSQAKPKASNSAGSSKSRPPRSVSELGEVADSYKLSPNQHSVKKWCSSASTIFEKASEFRLLHKDDEEAYILLLRGVSIVFQLIPKHPDFSSPDRTYRELEKEALESMETLEKLKISLTQRYDQWKAAQEETAAAAASAKKAEKRSVAIVGPSSAAEVGPAAIDFKFHSNNDPSFGRNTASPPLNNNSSTFNSPLQLAPFRPADIPMEPALTLNAPPSSVPDAHEVARESPRIPVSSPEPPPSPALHYDRSMTCPELHAGLAQVIEGLLASSVLILDVRPLENYIQGHMKWRRLRNNPKATFEMGSIFTSLVHIEPDWITTGWED